MAFRVEHGKGLIALRRFREFAGFCALGLQVTAKLRCISSLKSNLKKQIRILGRFGLLQFDLLILLNREAQGLALWASIGPRSESENAGIEIAGTLGIRDDQSDARDARNTGANGFVLRAERQSHYRRGAAKNKFSHNAIPIPSLYSRGLFYGFRQGVGGEAARSLGRWAGSRCGRRGCRGGIACR